MKNTTVNVVVKKQLVKTIDLTNQSMSIKAVPNMDLVIKDKLSKQAVNIKAKRQGDDLVLTSDDGVDLIVQDYYNTENVEIFGMQGNDMVAYNLNGSQAVDYLGGVKVKF